MLDACKNLLVIIANNLTTLDEQLHRLLLRTSNFQWNYDLTTENLNPANKLFNQIFS